MEFTAMYELAAMVAPEPDVYRYRFDDVDEMDKGNTAGDEGFGDTRHSYEADRVGVAPGDPSDVDVPHETFDADPVVSPRPTLIM